MFGMKPVEIKVNGIPVEIGQQCIIVKSLEVNHMNMGLQIDKSKMLPVADWMWDLVQRCESEYITYQGFLILKSEVTEWSRGL